jgi:hypothetical protein
MPCHGQAIAKNVPAAGADDERDDWISLLCRPDSDASINIKDNLSNYFMFNLHFSRQSSCSFTYRFQVPELFWFPDAKKI